MCESKSEFNAAWPSKRADYFEGLYNDIMQLRDSNVFINKRIAIVGVWNNIKEIAKIFDRLSMSIEIVADNNPDKQGLPVLNTICKSVDDLANEMNVVILVLNNVYWRDFQYQLLNLGLYENIDFFVLFGNSSVIEDEEMGIISKATWQQLCIQAERGYESYHEVMQDHGNKPVWFMYTPAIGDLYIFSLFLPAAMGEKSIEDCECVLVVTKYSTRKLAEALGFRNIVMITVDEAENWLILQRLLGDKLNIRNAVYHGLNQVFHLLCGKTKVTFLDSFVKYVFGFSEKVLPVYPKFPKRRDYVISEFYRLGLEPGRTVIIAPYAGHFEFAVTVRQWSRLTDALIAKGYSVCTNSGGETEPAIHGTVPVFPDLQDCEEFAEVAGYFIGVRSGLCDLLCMANCKRIVIYEKNTFGGSIDFFGFESMGIGNGELVEFNNDGIRTDELIDEIITHF